MAGLGDFRTRGALGWRAPHEARFLANPLPRDTLLSWRPTGLGDLVLDRSVVVGFVPREENFSEMSEDGWRGGLDQVYSDRSLAWLFQANGGGTKDTELSIRV